MAVATGMVVASNYYAQPLLDSIATYFDISATMAGFIVTTAQLSYAIGLILLVPLGDIFERRSLIITMTLISASGLLVTAMASNIWIMLLGTALSGMFSVVAQILVPFAATLAAPHQRGKAVGTIMSGLLLGILLARTVSGLMASITNWQGIFWVASVCLAILAITLWRCLPTYKSQTELNYFQLLGSIFKLFATTPVLRTRSLIGALIFAHFGLLWTSMAFLLSSNPFNYSDAVIGLFGLIGAAGALMASKAGGWVDKGKGKITTTVGLIILFISWCFIIIAPYFHWIGVVSFIIGVILLDLAVQGVHVTNQSTIYRILPDARNRLTAAYMTSYFIGGALGSLLSGYAYHQYGWIGVSIAGLVIGVLGLIVWLLGYKNDPIIQTK
ncbi:major facilitator superfamily (MFS) permease [Proteus hauseri ATCC 700826]|uniref:Major facilitator superfamily (MFS) permease n=2 Tax=Proteus hauseri TaxID=183417 RepID=A0AAJ3HT82_PROHU|nr:major facilitator superfamily (MFS) permease [Proteus hauseri ATCC 700826]